MMLPPYLEKLLVKAFDFRTWDWWQHAVLQTLHTDTQKALLAAVKYHRCDDYSQYFICSMLPKPRMVTLSHELIELFIVDYL